MAIPDRAIVFITRNGVLVRLAGSRYNWRAESSPCQPAAIIITSYQIRRLYLDGYFLKDFVYYVESINTSAVN